MRHMIGILLLGLAVLLSAGCGFHLRGSTQVPAKLQNMLLESSDPYGSLTRSIRQQLRLNNVNIVDDATRKDLPTLRIIGSSDSQSTVSIFKNGTSAENQLALKVQTQILMPGRGIYPLDVTVFRSFFNNPLTALAKEAESEIIHQQMRDQAAEKLIRKLLTVDVENSDSKEKQKNDPLAINDIPNEFRVTARRQGRPTDERR
ncbi:LPS assembly lipoprotein LptE [Candidatus Regiella endosymbiont of Tuberolachnus salignus]|uniref:LPS assembly lipoprotein LptE n=1 Tax=Candidatus Regiella endosymbiont of Tuberolachnus salignus TaxID=3077956 RepID=UPI0030D34BDD